MRYLGLVLGGASFVAGLILRWLYIFQWHTVDRYLYSDMLGYHRAAKNFCNPDYISGIADTVHPPGTRVRASLSLSRTSPKALPPFF